MKKFKKKQIHEIVKTSLNKTMLDLTVAPSKKLQKAVTEAIKKITKHIHQESKDHAKQDKIALKKIKRVETKLNGKKKKVVTI